MKFIDTSEVTNSEQVACVDDLFEDGKQQTDEEIDQDFERIVNTQPAMKISSAIHISLYNELELKLKAIRARKVVDFDLERSVAQMVADIEHQHVGSVD